MNDEYNFEDAPGIVRERVQQAVSTARDRAGEIVDRGRCTISEHPAASLVSVFAAGVVVGALVALATRPAPKPLAPAVAENAREGLAALFGSLAEGLREPLGRTYASAAGHAEHLAEAVGRAVETLQEKKRSWW